MSLTGAIGGAMVELMTTVKSERSSVRPGTLYFKILPTLGLPLFIHYQIVNTSINNFFI